MYQLTQNPNIIRKGGLFVPTDPANQDYTEYLAWVAAGNTPTPYVAPVIIPQVVSRFQAKAALLNAGLLPAVVAAMAQASPVAQLAWADAVEFRRDSPTVAGMAATLNLTGAQLDALFIAAAQIEA